MPPKMKMNSLIRSDRIGRWWGKRQKQIFIYRNEHTRVLIAAMNRLLLHFANCELQNMNENLRNVFLLLNFTKYWTEHNLYRELRTYDICIWLLVNPRRESISNIYITRFTIYNIWMDERVLCAANGIFDFSDQFKICPNNNEICKHLAIEFVDYLLLSIKILNKITIFR